MPRERSAYLADALRAADRVLDFVDGKVLAEYEADELLRSAVERKFEIIGEALNQLRQLDAALAARVPDLRQIVGFRNILVHGYASLDDEQVWYTIDDLSALRTALQALLDELDEPDE